MPLVAVETQTSLASTAAEWDELADRVDAPPFLRPGWIEAWWRAFGRGGLELVTLRRGGALAGLLPLQSHRRAVRSPTNWHTPEFALLAEDDEALRALARALFRAGRRRVSLGFLNGGEPSLEVSVTAAQEAGYRIHLRTLERSPYVAIEGAWADYERRVRKHRLTEARRRRRRLEEQGELVVEVADGSERLDALLEEGFRVEASGWKSERGTAIVSRPETRAFYTDVARWAAERGWLRLAFLRLDGRPLAFQYLIEAGGSVYFLKGGYETEYARFAPGTLLAQETLARAFAAGLRTYEFLGTEEPFKLEWTDLVRERIGLEAFAPSAPGLAEWAAFAYARPVAKRARGLLRR